jgi:hypothetical protein
MEQLRKECVQIKTGEYEKKGRKKNFKSIQFWKKVQKKKEFGGGKRRERNK